MWILDHGEALLKVDPLQPAQVVGLIHCVDLHLLYLLIRFDTASYIGKMTDGSEIIDLLIHLHHSAHAVLALVVGPSRPL